MANQITDNRILVNTFSSTAGIDDLTGNIAGTVDTEVFVGNSASITEYTSNTLTGLMADAGSAQNWSNNTFYIINNCGIVGQLQTKANGGWRVRFAGATASNYFEVYVGGADSWPPAVEGGWVQWVVDIETARAQAIANGWTGGTPPATSAIRYVGSCGITSTMPRMADNTWYGEIRRLPDGQAGTIVEGRNGGSVDWTLPDLITQLPAGTLTAKQGAGGSVVLNTKIQFGINDTTTHGFTDTNSVVLWEDQEFSPSDLYGFQALGNAGGTTNVTFGIKSGTGTDATGAQGAVISANASSVRWSMDFDDPNLDLVGLYGCTFIHGGVFELDNTVLEAISTSYIDITDAVVGGSFQSRVSLVNSGQFDQDGATFSNVGSSGSIGSYEISLNNPTSATNTTADTIFIDTASTDFTLSNITVNTVTVNNPLDVVINSGDNASIGAAINLGAGNVTIVAGLAPISITVQDASGSALSNARVSVTEVATSTEIINGGVNASGNISLAYADTTPKEITGWARSYDVNGVIYRQQNFSGTIEATGFSRTIKLEAE